MVAREGVERRGMIEAWRNTARAGTGNRGAEGGCYSRCRRVGGRLVEVVRRPRPRRRGGRERGPTRGRMPDHEGPPGPRVAPLTREDECGARDVQAVLL